jgi:large subunit ribosomal protein L18
VSVSNKILKRQKRRTLRIRSKIKSSSELLRVSIFRSLSNIYGQIIDDNAGLTLASCSTIELKNLTGDKKSKAKEVGIQLAKKALEKGITKAKFDRGNVLYHGRIEAFAQGLREGGLQI